MKTDSRNLRAFRTRYHGPTDTLGSRVSITDERFPETPRRYLPYDYEYNSAWEQAEAYLLTLGITCPVHTETRSGDILLLTDDFRTPLS